MSLITWNSKLSVGYGEMDAQHRKLVALINELHEAMTQGRAAGALQHVLDQVVAYTVFHFQTEERLMKAHRYPEQSAHEAEHRALVRTASELQASVKGKGASVTLATMHFLRDWLNHHIQGTDAKLGAFLAARAAHAAH